MVTFQLQEKTNKVWTLEGEESKSTKTNNKMVNAVDDTAQIDNPHIFLYRFAKLTDVRYPVARSPLLFTHVYNYFFSFSHIPFFEILLFVYLYLSINRVLNREWHQWTHGCEFVAGVRTDECSLNDRSMKFTAWKHTHTLKNRERNAKNRNKRTKRKKIAQDDGRDLTCEFYCLPTTISICNYCFNICIQSDRNNNIHTHASILKPSIQLVSEPETETQARQWLRVLCQLWN